MKINEVEALVGITKKNIRFYEEQGLLSPRRNSENGYRDYGEEEVDVLKKIKLFRKLGVPIEDIRRMLSGSQTLNDAMRRHMVTLEREQRNLEQCMLMCRSLQNGDLALSGLDAQTVLEQMEALEQTGASFRNKQTGDVRIRYAAPILIALLMVGLMAGVIALLVWEYIHALQDAPPFWAMVLMVLICLSVCGGVVLALFQRIQEIGKGEMEDAKSF